MLTHFLHGRWRFTARHGARTRDYAGIWKCHAAAQGAKPREAIRHPAGYGGTTG
jgi:hypothetical protein